MRRWVAGTVVLAAAVVVAGLGSPGWAGPGLRVEDGELVRDGQRFRGIGVNYFDAFGRVLKDAEDTSYEDGFATLAEKGIPFARFMCGGYWPADMALYEEDREAYFQRLDGVVASAEEHGVGLIPSLFWYYACVPDLVGEPMEAWGDPESETHAWMRQYVGEVVERYRDSGAIWAWEFGNEFNLACDLPNAAEHRPAVWPGLGTASERSERDELTHAMMRTAVRAFARRVRELDGERAILSGHSHPRRSAWHIKEAGVWEEDEPGQWAAMLAGDNPGPVDTLCVRGYFEEDREPPVELARDVSRGLDKPLVLGEFGVAGEEAGERDRARFERLLDLAEREADLAALWVFDFSGQDGEWNVTAENARAWQLEAVAERNARLREAGR